MCTKTKTNAMNMKTDKTRDIKRQKGNPNLHDVKQNSKRNQNENKDDEKKKRWTEEMTKNSLR